jgi:hypothetical protein
VGRHALGGAKWRFAIDCNFVRGFCLAFRSSGDREASINCVIGSQRLIERFPADAVLLRQCGFWLVLRLWSEFQRPGLMSAHTFDRDSRRAAWQSQFLPAGARE